MLLADRREVDPGDLAVAVAHEEALELVLRRVRDHPIEADLLEGLHEPRHQDLAAVFAEEALVVLEDERPDPLLREQEREGESRGTAAGYADVDLVIGGQPLSATPARPAS